MNATQLHAKTWNFPAVAHYVRASFRTLDKHMQRGQFDKQRAIRLLTNNARDAARHSNVHVSHDTLTQCAHMLLNDWHARRATAME